MFKHIPLELPKLKRVTVNGSRFYETPTGNKYPSVTGVTGLRGQAHIHEWRKRVGEEEANKISARASSRGTRIHSLCEDYLNNEPTKADMFDAPIWNSFVSVLNHIDNVYVLEAMLFSHNLEVAGTVDCVAEYDGVLSIIDFKTSRRIKELKDIPGYFIQCAMYAVAFTEMTGKNVPQLVVLMAIDDEEPKVFIQKTTDWLLNAFKERRYFKHRKGY
jgi:hypothetical protein